MKCKTFYIYGFLSLTWFSTVWADTQSQTLGDVIGATDVYKLNCSSLAGQKTAYATLQIRDDTPTQTNSSPQLINVALTKKGSAAVIKKIIESNSAQLVSNGGNGSYAVKIDTIGSNTQYKAQDYQISYQCFYDQNTATTASASGLRAGVFVTKTIKTGKTASYTINCNQKSVTSTILVNNKKKKVVTKYSTQYMQLNINNVASNINNNQAYINAQLTRIDLGKSINASDRYGDTDYGSKVQLMPDNSLGDGDYYLSIDTTADQNTSIKAKSYSFEYGCYAANGQSTSANLTQVQNQ